MKKSGRDWHDTPDSTGEGTVDQVQAGVLDYTVDLDYTVEPQPGAGRPKTGGLVFPWTGPWTGAVAGTVMGGRDDHWVLHHLRQC